MAKKKLKVEEVQVNKTELALRDYVFGRSSVGKLAADLGVNTNTLLAAFRKWWNEN